MDATTGNAGLLSTINRGGLSNTLNQLGNDFFFFKTINVLNWNKYYPFQIMILQENTSPANISATTFLSSEGSDYGYSVYQSCILTLPIPPESLSVSTPFASTTQVTLNGIVEEHAGAPIRIISLSGSTGMVPGKESALATVSGAVNQLGNTIFAGTVTQAASGSLGVAPNLSLSTITYNDNELASDTNFNSTRIGYTHFRLLEYLLDMYATLKNSSTQNASKFRLAFSMWKDEALYLVTPVNFEKRRTAASPMEYQYDIRLKAWKRIPYLNSDTDPISVQKTAVNQSALQNILSQVDTARTILQLNFDTLSAVRSDVQYTVFNPLRELEFFLKSSINATLTLNDIPMELLQNFQSVVINSWNTTISGVRTAKGVQIDLHKISELFDQTASIYNTQYDYSSTPVASTPGGLPNFPGGNAVTALFTSPDDFSDFFRQIKLSDLKVPPTLATLVTQQTQQIVSKTKSYFQQIRTNLIVAENAYADVVGVSDPTFNAIYGRTSAAQIRQATDLDFLLLHALADIISALNDLIAVQNPNPQSITPPAVNYVAGLAEKSGINFNIPASKFLIPCPYGITLERLAAQYLGDPDRWIEIATINNLREPYIDETGFTVPLLTNPTKNQIVVGSTQNLVIGQQVWLTAAYLPNFKTTIQNIQSINTSAGSMNIIYVDIWQNFATPQNISGYTSLQAYLPGTTNSQQLIYIPSDLAPNNDVEDLSNLPGVNDLDNLLQVGGIDLLLDQNNDIVVNNNGDFVFSFGLQNIIQTIKIGISTQRGSLIRHPNFGLPLSIGESLASISAKDILSATKDLFSGDPTFTGISGVSISILGPVVQITATVGIASTGNLIPITVNIKQGNVNLTS